MIGPMPPPPDPAGDQVPAPGAIKAASTLWIITGVLVTFAYGYAAFRAYGAGDDRLAALAAVFTVVGLVLWRFGRALRYGRDHRRALMVCGALVSIAIIPLILVIPAMVLQYQQTGNHWFALPPAGSQA
ncbi:hypothetical protein KIPE111705_15635 [Kibdelosporangium persicum]|uniref:Uncharacterized protein n=1 Tax=Kibdelosporangium persicum TaxID=2698649 RepID=A0ABX2F2E5_9PSEU|nr:hypothetical protein [Kibdelosporangium persicum]NRN65146.1 hypothetical protein [Kibdelosporangium persicum]